MNKWMSGTVVLSLTALLNVSRISGSTKRDYFTVPVVKVGTVTSNRTFADYIRSCNPRLKLIIDDSTIDAILDSSSVRLSRPLTKRYVHTKLTVESGDDAYAISPRDARGISQMRLDTWNEVAPNINYEDNWFKPEISIPVAEKYLNWIVRGLRIKYPDWEATDDTLKLDMISSAYNAGPTALEKAGWDITSLPAETAEYVGKMHMAMYNDSTYVDRLFTKTLQDSLAQMVADTIRGEITLAYSDSTRNILK
jgi:hypothetical protein